MANQPTNNFSLGKFKRLNYYHGMLLTEQDFQAEQSYFREKMKLHNRMHGFGVVWGLEIVSECTKIEGKPVHKIFVKPGLAFDCEGNEIIVCQRYQVPIDEMIDRLADSCEPIDPCTKLLIAIKYYESESEPRVQYATKCGEEDQQEQYSRIGEGYSVQVLLKNEAPDCCKNKEKDKCCEKQKQDCPGLAVCCEEEHVIILGCINLDTQCDTKKDESQRISDNSDASKNMMYQHSNEIRSLIAAKSSDRNFNSNYIGQCCEPPRVCIPCPTPQEKWEQQKQRLLQEAEARECSDLVDFSGAIGKSVYDAREYLNKLDLNVSDQLNAINSYEYEELREIIESAKSYAKNKEYITLITDEKGQCVVFAYVDTKEKSCCNRLFNWVPYGHKER